MTRHLAKAAAALLGSALLAPLAGHAQVYASADYNRIAEPGQTVSGLDLGLGYRLEQYLGVEAGYEGAYSNLPFSGGYLVALGYLPFGDTGFEAFGDAGGLVLTGETSAVTGSSRRWGSGYRADAGVEYDLSPSWTIRAAYRVQSPLAFMHAYVAGLVYSF